jgi:hypothetical protein
MARYRANKMAAVPFRQQQCEKYVNQFNAVIKTQLS